MDSPSLHDRRLAFVTGLLLDAKAGRVLDLGCGAGRLLARLVREPGFTRITGLDASASSLAVARGELAVHLASGRLVLLHGQVYAPHPGAGDADAVTLVEVIELSRDYVSPPQNSTGTTTEREVLADELRREMAASILRRVDGVVRSGQVNTAR